MVAHGRTARIFGAPPSAIPIRWNRPVSGLASGVWARGTAPSHAFAQWRIAVPILAYRCGGSAGIAPWSAPASRLIFLANAIKTPEARFYQTHLSRLGSGRTLRPKRAVAGCKCRLLAKSLAGEPAHCTAQALPATAPGPAQAGERHQTRAIQPYSAGQFAAKRDATQQFLTKS